MPCRQTSVGRERPGRLHRLGEDLHDRLLTRRRRCGRFRRGLRPRRPGAGRLAADDAVGLLRCSGGSSCIRRGPGRLRIPSLFACTFGRGRRSRGSLPPCGGLRWSGGGCFLLGNRFLLGSRRWIGGLGRRGRKSGILFRAACRLPSAGSRGLPAAARGCRLRRFGNLGGRCRFFSRWVGLRGGGERNRLRKVGIACLILRRLRRGAEPMVAPRAAHHPAQGGGTDRHFGSAERAVNLDGHILGPKSPDSSGPERPGACGTKRSRPLPWLPIIPRRSESIPRRSESAHHGEALVWWHYGMSHSLLLGAANSRTAQSASPKSR